MPYRSATTAPAEANLRLLAQDVEKNDAESVLAIHMLKAFHNIWQLIVSANWQRKRYAPQVLVMVLLGVT